MYSIIHYYQFYSQMKYKYTVMIMCAIHIKGIQYQEWSNVITINYEPEPKVVLHQVAEK